MLHSHVARSGVSSTSFAASYLKLRPLDVATHQLAGGRR
jgi:hypothetical protein